MNWIFEHMQLVVLVGGAIAYWLNQRRKAKEEAEAMRELEAQQARPVQMQRPVDDEAERVRRIQEEIRRKILERAGGAVPKPQPPPMPEPRYREEVLPGPAPVQTRMPAEPDAYAQAAAEEQAAALDQAVLERQQRLSAQLRELDEKRRHTVGKAEAFAEKTAAAMASSDTAARGSLLADLRNPASVRRAIVLREVLGPPVALR
ncbi:MAG: hypothetical protein QM715_08520 [Nibricoccus sp.]